MKILVTGASGFVGKHLLKTLSADGHELIATYRSEPPSHSREYTRNVRWLETDFFTEIMELAPVDAIIHMATVHYQSRKAPQPADFVHTNILSTLNLCDYARKNEIKKFIHFSTVTVYGNVQVPTLTETTPVDDPDFYGATKYLGERIVNEYAKYFPVIVLRLPAILGPNYFIPWLGRVLLKAFKDETIEIFNGQEPFNNITDVQEISKLVPLLLAKHISGNNIFNVAASKPISLKEAVDFLIKLTGSRSPIREISAPKQSFQIEINRLIKMTGFKAEDTRTLIERYVTSNLTLRTATRLESC